MRIIREYVYWYLISYLTWEFLHLALPPELYVPFATGGPFAPLLWVMDNRPELLPWWFDPAFHWCSTWWM